jgi:hypothetical protein
MDIAVACALAGIEPHSPAWSVAMSTGRLPDYDSSVKPPGSLAGSGATGRPPSAVREPAAANSASPAGNPSLLGPTPATPLPDWRPASGTGAAPTATADSWTDELDQSLTAQNVDPPTPDCSHPPSANAPPSGPRSYGSTRSCSCGSNASTPTPSPARELSPCSNGSASPPKTDQRS